jgi:SpoIID/LytB domain protein
MAAAPMLERQRPRADLVQMRRTDMDATYHRPGRLLAPRLRAAAGAARTAFLAIATLLSAVAVLAGPGAGAASAASTAPMLVIEGAGDGHGVGMSQDGALGYAEHGYDYQQILSHYYTNTTLGQAPSGSIVKVLVGSKVQSVPLERYVRGVVSAEMSASWPLAALEAQAVASRTYALTTDAGGSRFQVYSDTRSQVYLGVAAETSATNTAVADTAGQIVLYDDKPAATYFFASSGGMTEDVQYGFPGAEAQPWLVGVPDVYESSTSRWKADMSLASAAKRLAGLFKGSFRGIEVLQRGASPRIVSARVLGSAGSSTLDGPELAGRLGLQSTWEYFSVLNDGVLHSEPDRSGRAKILGPTGTPTTTPPPAPAPPSADGGTSAGSTEAAAAAAVQNSGGTPAG